jgi:hypothetical protein
MPVSARPPPIIVVFVTALHQLASSYEIISERLIVLSGSRDLLTSVTAHYVYTNPSAFIVSWILGRLPRRS